MEKSNPDPDAWWASTIPPEKTFYRDLTAMVQATQPHQRLELSFNGESYEPVLIQEKPPAHHHPAKPRKSSAKLRPEQWWAQLTSAEKAFVQELAGMVKQIGGDKILHLHNTGYSFKIALVLNLKPSPIPGMRGGRASTN